MVSIIRQRPSQVQLNSDAVTLMFEPSRCNISKYLAFINLRSKTNTDIHKTHELMVILMVGNYNNK